MYTESGAFGQVRLASRMEDRTQSGFFTLAVVGWHSCNDLYHINRPNGADMPLLLYTVAGCGDLRIGARCYKLYPGSLAVVPANRATAYGVPMGGHWEFYWLHVCGDAACRFLEQATIGDKYHTATAGSDYSSRFEELMQLSQEFTFDVPLRISQQLSHLLHSVAADLQPRQNVPTLSQRAQDYMQAHFREPLTIETIARPLYVSGAYLIRVFKQETGQTPHQFLLHCRLRAAVQLLRFSDLHTNEIADRVGFSSASHFISCFRKHYGCTPLHYRDSIHQNAGTQERSMNNGS